MAQLNNLLVTGSAKFLNTVTGNIDGNASTATSATKATQDESGNNIKSTYAASASISGNTVTLKNKNGGTLSTVTIPSELPSVSSSDNDKVLTVVNGSWAAAASGGGSLVVNFTTLNSPPDKSFSEVLSAIQNGVIPTAIFDGQVYVLSRYSSTYIEFVYQTVGHNGPITEKRIYWTSTNVALYQTQMSRSEFIILSLYHLNAGEPDFSYQDPPAGDLGVEGSEDISDVYNMASFVASGYYIGAVLINGSATELGQFETYMPVWSKWENTENTGWSDLITIVFQNVGFRNGEPLIKRITVSGEPYTYDWTLCTVTYSETVINTNRTASITLTAANWTGNGPYTQTVTISGATISSNTKVDLQPDATAITQMLSDGVMALYIDNNSGTLTATAVGAAPTANMTIQCTY